MLPVKLDCFIVLSIELIVGISLVTSVNSASDKVILLYLEAVNLTSMLLLSKLKLSILESFMVKIMLPNF